MDSHVHTHWIQKVTVTVFNNQYTYFFLLGRQTDTSLMAAFPGQPGKAAPERLTILDFNKARDDGVAVASAGPHANHLHLAPESRQITTPAPRHSFLPARNTNTPAVIYPVKTVAASFLVGNKSDSVAVYKPNYALV